MTIKEGYLIENFEIPETEETGEVGERRVSDEVVTKVDEEIKREREEYAESIEFEENDGEEISFEDFLKDKLGEETNDIVLMQIDFGKSEKPQINSHQMRELNRRGLRLV